ncbi:MAG: cytochrome P450 [Nitratireductor sp.]
MKNIFSDKLFNTNPFLRAQEWRSQGPLVQTKIPILGKVWITTTQKATGIVLKNSANFTLRKANGKVTGLQWWMPKSLQLLADNMLTMDEPDHSRLRHLVDTAFRRDVIVGLTPRIDAIANELAIEMKADLEKADGQVDLIDRFARRLPLAVICELLGLAKEDHELFAKWAGKMTNVENVFQFSGMFYPLRKMRKYLAKEIARQRIAPNNGLIGELVAMQKEGAQISDDEMIAMVFLLLLAGHETTTHVISGGIFELLKNPDQIEVMLKDDSSLSVGCEELLRYVSAVQFSKPRNVKNDIVVEGVELKKGDVVLALLVGANGDPDANECPHKFDVARKPNKHLAFGAGPHFCLGHQLARVEIASSIKAIFKHCPDVRLACRAEDVRYKGLSGIRRISALPVKA